MPRSAKGDQNLARGERDACTAFFAPSSTFRNPARMESALAAWCGQQTIKESFLHAGTGNHLVLCCGANQQLHAHAARPHVIFFPMGHRGGEQGIVECIVSYMYIHVQGGELNGTYRSLNIVNATSGWL